ncbi:hypothetical protein C0J52_20646 [Blattella germanica]|nr:hypothetical protein C0J52_20646 [Blattella germanica]
MCQATEFDACNIMEQLKDLYILGNRTIGDVDSFTLWLAHGRQSISKERGLGTPVIALTEENINTAAVIVRDDHRIMIKHEKENISFKNLVTLCVDHERSVSKENIFLSLKNSLQINTTTGQPNISTRRLKDLRMLSMRLRRLYNRNCIYNEEWSSWILDVVSAKTHFPSGKHEGPKTQEWLNMQGLYEVENGSTENNKTVRGIRRIKDNGNRLISKMSAHWQTYIASQDVTKQENDYRQWSNETPGHKVEKNETKYKTEDENTERDSVQLNSR